MKAIFKNSLSTMSAFVGGLTIMSTALAITFKNDDEKFSYIVGSQIASSILNDNLKIDRKIFIKAIEDGLDGKPTEISPQDSQAFMSQYMAAQNKMRSEKNLKEGQEFLAKNKTQSGVVTLPSGLQYKILVKGKGPKPNADDTVSVDYEGTLVNGKIFDSSYQRGQPVSFPVSGVIKGWTEALQLMPEGSTWTLYVPANLAYGERAPSPVIGPNSTLIFKVHLISITKKPAPVPKPTEGDKSKPSEGDKSKLAEVDKSKPTEGETSKLAEGSSAKK